MMTWYPNRKKLTDELSVLIVGWWPINRAGNAFCPNGTGSDDHENPYNRC